MPRKRKKKIFSAAKIVREMARERVGSPKPSQTREGKDDKSGEAQAHARQVASR